MNAQPNLGMQVTTFENPMGIDGFEFVEFAAPAGRGQELHELFRKMGFTAVLRHKSRPITVYRQNGVNFLVNEDPDSFAADFAAKHGPCACGFAIRFKMPADEVGCSRTPRVAISRRNGPRLLFRFTERIAPTGSWPR